MPKEGIKIKALLSKDKIRKWVIDPLLMIATIALSYFAAIEGHQAAINFLICLRWIATILIIMICFLTVAVWIIGETNHSPNLTGPDLFCYIGKLFYYPALIIIGANITTVFGVIADVFHWWIYLEVKREKRKRR